MKKRIVIICGPTASGKSAFAARLCELSNGAIINADSMQIYKEIPILTASPTEGDKKLIPHYLYNYLSIGSHFSVAKYIDAASIAIRTLESKKLPIIVGGTGLYINGLVMGINAVPDIDPEIKKEAQNLMESSSKEEFHRMLSDLDSAAASHIKAGDKQRMIRAYEVFRGTGKSILYFNSLPTKSPLDDYNISVFMLSPDRELLYKNCNDRFLKLLEIGALDEVRSNLEKQSPALGFMELKSYLNSEVTLDEAINLAQTKTRRYAKRQVTWFTHQLQNKKTLSFSSIDQYYNILENITKWVDL